MLLSALFFVAVAAAAPANRLVVHEKRSIPEHVKRQRVHGDAIIPVRIGLTQSNLDEGYAHLMHVSDPDSPSFGKHWTTEQIHAKFAPSDNTIEAVKSWLEESGFHRDEIAESASRGWLKVDMPVHRAESLFRTEYFELDHGDGDLRVGCDMYHVPSHLSAHIDHLTPGVMASAPLQKVKAKRTLNNNRRDTKDTSAKIPYISPTSTSSCGEYITPACLKAMYGIPDAKYNQPENTLGVFEFYDVYDQTDLDIFFSHYAPWVPNGTHPTLVSVNDAKAPVPINSSLIGGESLVDFELAYSLVYPQEITLYQAEATSKQYNLTERKYGNMNITGNVLGVSTFLDALDGAFCTKADREAGVDCGTIELTRVLSMSYGWNELFIPEAFAKRACAEYMKFALKGHTIVVSSGDFGPAGKNQLTLGQSDVPTNGCIDLKHLYSYSYNGTIFNPQFPAVCPWVTTVGGTQLDRQDTAGDAERALHIRSKLETPYPQVYTFGTSGGVSNYFPMPEYQKCAVDGYFKNYDPGYPTYEYSGVDSIGANGGIYARGGRAFPDIAANGAHMATFLDGEFYPQGETGTSLSAPIFASIITLINQERTNAGKGPVGFVNPVIYKHPEFFRDITRGNVPGCHTSGFSAVEGWDPTTGLGTPNYPALLNYFMSLP